MSTTNYDDGEIYYDNMEIAENIQKVKNAKAKKNRPPIPSQPPPTIVNNPPRLPPKKKNLGKLPRNIAAQPPTKPSLLKNNSNKTSSKESKKQNNATPPRQLSIPNASFQSTPQDKGIPSNFSPQVKISPSPPESINKGSKKVGQQISTPPKKNAIPQSPINPKPAQVWSHPSLLRTRSIVEEPLAPIVEEDTASEISPRSSIADEYSLQHSLKNSEDESASYDSQESTPNAHVQSKPNIAKQREVISPSKGSGPRSGSKYPNTGQVQANKPSEELEIDDDGSVKPYGMVDLQRENTHSLTHNRISARTGQNRQESDFPIKGSLEAAPALDKTGLAERSLSRAQEAARSHADLGHSSEDSGSGVCAYMSIPIQMQTGSFENAPQNKSRIENAPVKITNKDKYKDDEYIYDEIQDYNKDVVSSCDDAMQKALDDINEVLQSMNIEGITKPIPQPRARRFPKPAAEKPNAEGVEYDNFASQATDQTKSKPSGQSSGGKRYNGTRQEMALPAPPEPPPSPSTNSKRVDSNNMKGSPTPVPRVDVNFQLGRSSSDDSDSRDPNRTENKPNLLDAATPTLNNKTQQPIRASKSRESIAKPEFESSSSRRTSRDVEESSEADSCSVSGKQSDTTSGIVKSAGNSMSSLENLRGSTKSLGRSTSFDRKKSSSFRSKFKFRMRSKSQDRYREDSDSLGHVSGVSDAEEKSKSPRQRGSRLRRRLSRKRMENKEAAETKSVEEFKVTSQSRPSPSVSFIRKLLRKSKQSSSERPVSYGKPVIATPTTAQISNEVHADISSPTSPQSEPARDKQMVSPPSRRARKMLHPRAARDKAMSDSSNSDMDNDYRRNVQSETLKQKDEYLEPCDPRDTRASGDSTKERGRRMNTYRSKQARDRLDSSGLSSLHREKYKALVSLNAQTLKKITEKWLKEWRNKLPVGGFLITSWADIVIASKHPQCTIGKTVIYESYFATNPEHRLACQIFDRKDVNARLIAQLENCSTLTAHPTLCSVCSHFYCKVPGSLLYPPREESHVEALCVVLSNVPAASLATYISRLREVKDPKQKHKQILLMLLQLLQAMDNLSRSGFPPSNITVDNLIVTQDMGLLQVMPHMDALDHSANGPVRPKTMMSQFSGVLSWTLQIALDHEGMSTPSFPLYSYLSAILRISRAIVNSAQELEVGALQRLVQCSLWGPKSRGEVSVADEETFDTLSAWIEVKQAELVNDIAVLFAAKSDVFPIYLFYKHEYFSRIDPRTLFQNLRVLGRI